MLNPRNKTTDYEGGSKVTEDKSDDLYCGQFWSDTLHIDKMEFTKFLKSNLLYRNGCMINKIKLR